MAETKPKPTENLRTPKTKKKLGLKVPPALRLPHEDLIKPAQVSVDVSLSESGSLPNDLSQAPQIGRLPENVSLPDSDRLDVSDSLDLMASLPDAEGFTQLWHQMTDHLYNQLTLAEQAVHIQLFRLSWGRKRGEATCKIGLPRLCERTGIRSQTTVHTALQGLIRKGLVRKLGATFGKGKEQGSEYAIIPPPALVKQLSLPENVRLVKSGRLPESTSLSDSGSNKDKYTNKENTQTQDGVGVSSKFNLEECRRYADHLHKTGQGITNPGGYATKIYRSGEADALVEKFISPAPVIDVSKCPECEGKGYYFPDPVKPETVRCKHERLSRVN